MTTRATVTCVFRVPFFLAFAALTSACDTGSGGQGAASGNVEVSAETKADVTASTATRADSNGARPEARAASNGAQLEARAVPGQAQLDVAAAQLAEANARLNALASASAAVQAKTQPGNPSLKVGKAGALVDAKVQPGSPSLNVGKAGTLIDANVQAGNPSLNIGGLKAAANTSASAGTQTTTSKTGGNAAGKASLGVGQ